VSELPPSARGVYPDVQVRFIDAEASAHTRFLAVPRTPEGAKCDAADLAPGAQA
jgi:hypothetical protein